MHTQTAQSKKALTFADLRHDYSLSRESTHKLIKNGTFKALRITPDSPRSKWLISAASVTAWLEGKAPEPDRDRETKIAAKPAEAALIALASLPYMDAGERREIETRWKNGELTLSTIDGKPVLLIASAWSPR